MKRIGTILALLATIGLTACASAPAGSPSMHTEPPPLSKAERYRKAVQLNAERNNVRVHWVNPPADKDLDAYDEADQGR